MSSSHVFFSYPRPVQWTVALLSAALFAVTVIAGFALPLHGWRLLLVPLVILALVAPLESLLLTPLYAVSGRFRYYSPFLFSTRRADGGLDLHVGTLFDYVVHLHWRERGSEAARRITADLLRGLLALCDEAASGRMPPGTELVATSYFFSNRTLARLGFTPRPAPALLVLNLLLASLSVALRLSFTRGRPAFPELRHVRQAASTAGELERQQATITRLLYRLERASSA